MKNKSKLTKGFVWTVFTIALLLLLSLQAGRAQAATFVVNSTADAVDAAPGNGSCATAAGVCTLRAAIQEANALPGADTITVPAGTYTLTITGVNEDLNATGDLDITSDLTITGAGANTTAIDAGGIDRVLEVRWENKPNVSISGLTVTGGKTLSTQPGGGSGGGILTQGALLTLTNVTVSGNTAGNQGGGILKTGPLTLNSCTVSNNTAGFEPGTPGGGGIMDYINGTLTINNSTISGNSSPYGGGIGSSNYPLDILMTNSTVSNNTGGGLQVRNGRVTMKNSLLDNGGFNCFFTRYGPAALVSLGHNLSTDNSCAAPILNVTGGLDPAKGDLNNTPAQLAPLELNVPGSTRTHALCTGPGTPHPSCGAVPSPAIDKGGDCLAVDQRGLPRPQGAACDMGAYEVGSVQDTIPPETTIASVVDGNALAVASGGSTLSASITFTFGGTDAVRVAGFQCSRDGSAYADCSTPLGYSALTTGSHTFQVRALDAAGNVDPTPASFTWTILTPAQAIENLITTINNMGLPGGVATSLTAPLSNINTNNKAAACAKLNAFISQVNTKVQNGQLTSAQGNQLLQAANAIKASLGC